MEADDEPRISLLDMLNRAQVHVVAIAFFALLLPVLYRVEDAVKNAATQEQVQELNSKFDALEETIKQHMKRPERWESVKNPANN